MTTPAPADDPAAGRPLEGPGSLGRLAPRALALLLDWLLCSLIASAFFGYRWGGTGAEDFKPLLVFAIENIALVSTLGFTVGHRVVGFQVQRAHGGAPGLIAGTVRTIALCLVVPAVITDAFGRGYHDKLAGTLIVRTR